MIKYVVPLFLIWSCSVDPAINHSIIQKKYFPSGKLLELRHIRNGAKNGLQTGYWENGKKRFEYLAVNDVCEGELKEWAENGMLFHLAHYKNGQEDGVQKMWHPDGRLRSNFILINGRRYGLLGTKNCKNTDERFFAN